MSRSMSMRRARLKHAIQSAMVLIDRGIDRFAESSEKKPGGCRGVSVAEPRH